MDKVIIKDTLGYGVLLWFIGYVLGFVFFMFMPANMIGWAITPIGVLITIWVLAKKIKSDSPVYYLKIAVVWTIIAVLFDYVFLVKLLNPTDGYYKFDVYLYYFLTFAMPLVAGILKGKNAGGFSAEQQEKKKENKAKIMEMLEAGGKITNRDVENKLKVSDATVVRYLDELEKEGKLKQVGKTGQSVFYSKI